MTLTDRVRDLLTDALRAAQADGRLPDVPVDEVTVERPQNPEHGDFATSTPMKLARVMRRNPFDIAEAIASSTPTGGILASVEAVRPGFVNLSSIPPGSRSRSTRSGRLGTHTAASTTATVPASRSSSSAVNPTGPIHVGHGRGAVSEARSPACSKRRDTTYSANTTSTTAGNQMDKFNQSVYARYVQASGGEARGARGRVFRRLPRRSRGGPAR